MIDRITLERLKQIGLRTGMSTSEQIRRGIQWWLERREWPRWDDPEDDLHSNSD